MESFFKNGYFIHLIAMGISLSLEEKRDELPQQNAIIRDRMIIIRAISK